MVVVNINQKKEIEKVADYFETLEENQGLIDKLTEIFPLDNADLRITPVGKKNTDGPKSGTGKNYISRN